MEWHKNGIYAVFMQEISMRTENFVVNPRKIRPDDLIQSSGRSVLIVGTKCFNRRDEFFLRFRSPDFSLFFSG